MCTDEKKRGDPPAIGSPGHTALREPLCGAGERNVTRPILACGERTPGRHQNFPETAFTSPKNAKAVVYDQRQRLAWPGVYTEKDPHLLYERSAV